MDNVEVADGEDELQKQQQQLDDAAAEAKSRDEVEEAVDGTNGTTAAVADLMMFTPSSPEQFDNTLPPAKKKFKVLTDRPDEKIK